MKKKLYTKYILILKSHNDILQNKKAIKNLLLKKLPKKARLNFQRFYFAYCKGGSFHKCSDATLPMCPELLLNILPLSSSNKLDLRLYKDLHLMNRRITDEGHEWL